MERSSMTKIVSFHMEQCSLGCPNSDVCYHKRKTLSTGSVEGVFPNNFREEMLEQGYIIHESICNPPTAAIWHLLDSFSNYNITIPFELLNPGLMIFNKQLQITVHTAEQAKEVLEYQKLFLIKDDQTMDYVIEKHLWNIPFSYMHFCIDQDWVTKEKLQELMYYRMLSNTIGITIDSCAESWAVNGRCPYQNGTYIDITFDGTLRTCPFDREGVQISEVFNGDYESLFSIVRTSKKCKYSEFFSRGS